MRKQACANRVDSLISVSLPVSDVRSSCSKIKNQKYDTLRKRYNMSLMPDKLSKA